MASSSLRLRRVLTLSSSLIKHQRPISSVPAISGSSSLSSVTATTPISQNRSHLPLPFQSRPFHSSSVTLAPPRSFNNSNNNDEIGPDTILFEGCDYNHWLITMDFPKDPKPTPEEMVETYVQTLAKVVGSVEEAKKRMYACSTTTYTGFQAVMTEEMSEKFRGLPGVVFILPDSYIDPVNKEYGGDKYINGTIIPRPPPVQYGRQGGRYGDRNRDFNRNRPRGPPGPPPYQGNSAHDNQGSMHGDTRNFGGQHNGPQQNYGPSGTVERRDTMPMNNTPGGRYGYQGDGRDSRAPYQANYNRGDQGSEHPQGQRDFPAGDRRDFPPRGQREIRGDNMNYAPTPGGAYGQGSGGNYGQGVGGAYGQGAGGNHGQGVGGGYGQGASQNFGQGTGGTYGQGAGSSYGQTPEGHVGEQRFSEWDQRNNTQGGQRNYAATGPTGTDQGRY